MALQAVHPPASSWRELLQRALTEDIGAGDLTSHLTLSANLELEAVLVARSELVVCGLELAATAFSEVDSRIRFSAALKEGEIASCDAPLAFVSGPAHGILAAERTALNFVARMSGVATTTRNFVQQVAGTGAKIVDTRKTLPGWRVLDKYAVAVGGGVNHRAGLFDAVLVKDNHIAAVGGVAAAVEAARSGTPAHLWLQVEVESEADAEAALKAGADSLLLDNRSLDELQALTARFGARTTLEASGGIDLGTVRRVAETGVHRISIGALTHSAPSADISLEVHRGPARPARHPADRRDASPADDEVAV